jgi:hypothetical protein
VKPSDPIPIRSQGLKPSLMIELGLLLHGAKRVTGVLKEGDLVLLTNMTLS